MENLRADTLCFCGSVAVTGIMLGFSEILRRGYEIAAGTQDADDSGGSRSEDLLSVRAGRAAEEGAAPFVKNVPVLFARLRAHGTSNLWLGRGLKTCLYCGAAYMLAYSAAEAWFPGLYRRWLDGFFPLAEFFARLTPRGGIIQADLASHGYSELAVFARHAAGMARFFAAASLPFFAISLVAAARAAPLHLSCTRRTAVFSWLVAAGILASSIAAIPIIESQTENYEFASFFVRVGNTI